MNVETKVLIPYQKLKIEKKNVVMDCENKLYDNQRSTVRFFLNLWIMPFSFIRTMFYYTGTRMVRNGDKGGSEWIKAIKKISSPWTVHN